MSNSKTWPVVLGVTAGVVGGIVAGLYISALHQGSDLGSSLRSAQEVIDVCHEKIKEIEAGLDSLRPPITAHT